MNLNELTTTIYSNELKDQEAFNVFMTSMDTVNKVHKNAKVVFGQNEQENKAVTAFLENHLASVNKGMVLWHGVYRGDAKSVVDNPAQIEYWFFMHSLLVIHNIEKNHWGFCYPVTKKELMKTVQSVQSKNTEAKQE